MTCTVNSCVVVQFDFTGVPQGRKGMKRWRLVMNPAAAELCLQDPGHEVDLLLARICSS